jgi:hypothetical protein
MTRCPAAASGGITGETDDTASDTEDGFHGGHHTTAVLSDRGAEAAWHRQEPLTGAPARFRSPSRFTKEEELEASSRPHPDDSGIGEWVHGRDESAVTTDPDRGRPLSPHRRYRHHEVR